MGRRGRIEHPESFALGMMFAVGATVAIAVTLIPHGSELNRTGWVVNSSLAFPVAALLIPGRYRLPTWTYHGMLVMGAILVTNGIWLGHGGTASVAAAFFFIWVPLYTFWAWPWRPAAAHVAIDAVLLAVGLRAAEVAGAPAVWLIIVTTSSVAAVVVALMRRELSALATKDPLTLLPNRAHLEDVLPREIARARRTGVALSLAVLDVDGLKAVNDHSGHHAGDELLRTAATAWRSQLRATDLLVRVGGDEFVVVLPGTSATESCSVLTDLRRSTPVSFSAGVTDCRVDDDPASLIGRADELLYAAKRGGRSLILSELDVARRGPVAPAEMRVVRPAM